MSGVNGGIPFNNYLAGLASNGNAWLYSSDLDALDANSIYGFSAASVTNAPAAFASGTGVVNTYRVTANAKAQVITGISGDSAGKVWRRSYVSGVWSAWLLQSDGDVDGARAAKAWVNFDGTGTVAIRDSYNVASITDNGTGSYTVNFTSAMADANYCLGGFATYGASTVSAGLLSFGNDFAPTTTACPVKTSNAGNAAAQDANFVNVLFFGN